MSTITIAEAQAKLPEFIHQLEPGQELVITEDNQPVAKIVSTVGMKVPRLGSLKGSVVYQAPDFDAPLEEFKEYR